MLELGDQATTIIRSHVYSVPVVHQMLLWAF